LRAIQPRKREDAKAIQEKNGAIGKSWMGRGKVGRNAQPNSSIEKEKIALPAKWSWVGCSLR